MSYILDALKRSEQERHQGELNHATIDTIMIPKKAVKHYWWPYALIVALCVNVLAFIYFQFSTNVSVDVSKGAPSIEKAGSPELDNRANEKQGQQYMPSHAIEKPLPSHLMKTPKLTKRYEAPTPIKQQSAQKTEKMILGDTAYDVIRPKGYSENSSAKSSYEDVYLQQESVEAERIEKPIEESIEEEQKVEEANAAMSDAAGTETRHVEANDVIDFSDIQHINDMPVAFQKNIPDIRFNSHIYSLTPADRRVMINDLYLREGQDFSGVVIDSIGEYYLLLSKGARRFKIPVLRDWQSPR